MPESPSELHSIRVELSRLLALAVFLRASVPVVDSMESSAEHFSVIIVVDSIQV